MKRLATLALLGVVALSLPACVAIKLSPAGPYASGATAYTLGQDWNDITQVMYLPKGVRLLTLDGPQLNRLYLTEGLAPGAGLVRTVTKERPAPTYHTGSSPTELVEFVADSAEAMGYQAVETSGVRRVEISGKPGLQFELTGRTAEGLDVSGLGQVVESGDRLYVGLYLAPTEHYFAAARPEAERILKSQRF